MLGPSGVGAVWISEPFNVLTIMSSAGGPEAKPPSPTPSGNSTSSPTKIGAIAGGQLPMLFLVTFLPEHEDYRGSRWGWFSHPHRRLLRVSAVG